MTLWQSLTWTNKAALLVCVCIPVVVCVEGAIRYSQKARSELLLKQHSPDTSTDGTRWPAQRILGKSGTYLGVVIENSERPRDDGYYHGCDRG